MTSLSIGNVFTQQKPNRTIASFDVFDTTLTRVVGSPESAFLLLGKRLTNLALIDCSPEVFARHRIKAEQRALSNRNEVTLAQIYAELAKGLDLTIVESERLMEIECQLQASLLRPVVTVKNDIQAARTLGQRVVFISDMHLSADYIQAQLVNHGIWQEGDCCYVSCEYGKSKGSGLLFQEVLNIEAISASEMIHYGNDAHTDVHSAERLGLKTHSFAEGNLNRYEKILEKETWSTGGLSSLMAGASRLTRLSIPAESENEQALRDVSAGVVSPLLVSYVLWVLRRAQKLGLKRLYFLSRDGQILLEIARELIAKLNIACEVRYIYSSRLSWNLPLLSNTDENWIWEPLVGYCTVERLLDRLDVTPNEISEFLISAGFVEKDWCKLLDQNEIERLRLVLRNEQVKQIIFKKAASKREILIEYLNQEGLFDSSDQGIVDLGWSGTIYKAMFKFFQQIEAKPPVGFYFGIVREDVTAECHRLESYFYDKRYNVGSFDIWMNAALELFCSADHGTVLGFQRQNGRIEPILEEEHNQAAIDWGLQTVRKTVFTFVNNLLLDTDLVDPYIDVREVTAKVAEAFWFHPTRSEATAWGSLSWEEHLLNKGKIAYSCAETYTWQHVFQILTTGKFPIHHHLSWIDGSLAISPTNIATILKIPRQAKKLLGPLKWRLFYFMKWI